MYIEDSYHFNRRSFLKRIIAGTAGLAGLQLLNGCNDGPDLSHIKGRIVGSNYKTGHLLRNISSLPEPTETINTDVLIVGAGISGLSAARWLSKNSTAKVLMAEMDTATGGNSRYGSNNVSAYPFGAHYLPIPDTRNTELISFLQECGTIQSINEQGLPVYNDYHLCHDPEERLFINGFWQEGLIPDAGINEPERNEIQRFLNEMEQWKTIKGKDGLDAFAIPISQSSVDEAFNHLHNISFSQFLTENNYRSKTLHWYLEYGCKDDYGADLNNTSAWAGIHYFAARKGKGANANSSSILTWPEGNGFLSDQLKRQSLCDKKTSCLIYQVERTDKGITALCYDVAARKSSLIKAGKVIMTTPLSVTKRLLSKEERWKKIPTENFKHTPWVIANITLSGLPQGKGMPLCWDNVIYHSPSVGYVNASHQHLEESAQKVLTYYWPLTSNDPGKARIEMHQKNYQHWLSAVVADLEKVHPGITSFISHTDIWIWGHGMIMPSPGLMNSEVIKQAASPIDNTLFFAHTDLSGISIFEEAFYQGINAAKQVISAL